MSLHRATTTLYYSYNFCAATNSISFSIGPPHRQPAYKNLHFSTCILSLVSIYLILMPSGPILSLMEIKDLPVEFRWTLMGIILLGWFITWSYERFGFFFVSKKLKNNR
jgi:uncharacterized membrane protein